MNDIFTSPRPDDYAGKSMIPLAARSPATIRVPAAMQAAGSNFNPAELLVVLRRWWWQGLLAGSVAAGVTCAIAWHMFVPEYEASAWLEVKHQANYVLTPHGSSPVFSQTQLEIMRSPVVLSRVSSQEDVASLPDAIKADSVLAWLQKNLRVAYMNGSELCQVSFRCSSPRDAALVSNAVSDVYLALHASTTGEQTQQIIDLLKKQQEERQEEIVLAKDEVTRLTKETNSQSAVAAGEKNVALIDSPQARMADRLASAEVDRIELEAELKALEDAIAAGKIEVPEVDVQDNLDAHPELMTLRAQLVEKRSKLREHQQRVGPRSRDTIGQGMQAEIETLEGSIAKTKKELRAEVEEALKADLLNQQNRVLEEKQAAIDRQLALEKVWQGKIDQDRQKLIEVGGNNLKLEFAKSDLARSEDIYQRISDRIMGLQTERGAPSRVVKLKAATPPDQPIEASPWKRMGMFALACLAAPFGLAFLWERWQRRIVDSRQLATEANLPVLGEVTTLPTRLMGSDGRATMHFLRERVTFQESVDSLRVGLTLAPELRKVQTLAVTSAVSQEGKTSLAYSLAISIARSTGEPTLLIDADMRAPEMHEVFDVPLEPGLADVLKGNCAWEDAVTPTSQLVHLLPAGLLNTNPHLLLKDGGFAGLLEQVASRYRHVIIDSPPVLNASESLVIASAAQGTLVCALRDVSRASQLRAACQRLNNVGATLLGAVINGVPTRLWAYHHGGYGYAWDRYFSPAGSWGAATSSEEAQTTQTV